MNFTLHTLNGIKLWLVLLYLVAQSMFAEQILHDKPSTLTGDGNIVRGFRSCCPTGVRRFRMGENRTSHSFSTPYFMSKDFYVGYGWYRKAFPVKKRFLARKVFLNSMAYFKKQRFRQRTLGRHSQRRIYRIFHRHISLPERREKPGSRPGKQLLAP